MEFAVETNDKVILRGCRFRNDHKLDPDREQLPEPYPNQNHSWGFIGNPGSGKTSLIVNLLGGVREQKDGKSITHKYYRGLFDKIYVVSPSLNTLEKNIFRDGLPPEHLFARLTNKVARSLRSRLNISEEGDSKKKPPKPEVKMIPLEGERETKEDREAKRHEEEIEVHDDDRCLLILDDCMSKLKDKEIAKFVIDAVCNRRHTRGGLSVWITAQMYNAIPRTVRKNFTAICQFATTEGMDDIIKDHKILRKASALEEIMRFVSDTPHDFLFWDKTHPRDLYKNFQRIVRVPKTHDAEKESVAGRSRPMEEQTPDR